MNQTRGGREMTGPEKSERIIYAQQITTEIVNLVNRMAAEEFPQGWTTKELKEVAGRIKTVSALVLDASLRADAEARAKTNGKHFRS